MESIKEKKFLITGASGQLAQEFMRSFDEQGFDYCAPGESEFDITDIEKTEETVAAYKPDYILNCAAYNLVDAAEDNPGLVHKINADAVGYLAEACKKHGVFLVHFSSDYVFDGSKGGEYVETDLPNPLNEYGKSKLKGEKNVQEILSDYLIFRLSWVIGQGEQNFLYKVSQWAKQSPTLKISYDEVSSPTFTDDIVRIVLLSLAKELTGLYHLTSTGYASRYDLAKYFIEQAGLSNTVEPVSIKDFHTKARRPLFSAMSNKRIMGALDVSIPTWEEGVSGFVGRGD